MTELIGQSLGGYEVQALLGQGGMGVVYRARHVALDRTVALKVLLPELASDQDYVARFLREARAAAHLNHPNIIQIHDASVQEGRCFFVMELVDGRNLREVLRERKRLGESEALTYVRQAAAGLAFAHSRDIIHRDIKPENLLLGKDGVVKIVDLGLVKWKRPDADVALTISGAILGTPYYISPEQIRGQEDIDGRADIYSLGMTLYHFLAGAPPFSKGTAAEIMAGHLTETPRPLEQVKPEVSRPTCDLIATMIAREREARIPHMHFVVEEIARILDQPAKTPATLRQRDVPPLPERRKTGRFRIRLLAAIGIAVAGVLIFGGLALILKPKKNEGSPPSGENPTETSPENAPATPEDGRPLSTEAPAPKPEPAKPAAAQPPPVPVPGAPDVESLFEAAQKGDLAGLRSLLDQRMDLETKDEKGMTPLMAAAHEGQAGAVQLLLTKGARVDAKDNEGLTALTHAVIGGHNAIVKTLIAKGADVNAKDDKDETPLIRAITSQNLDTAKTLLAKGADVNSKDKEGNCALILAAALGQADLIPDLLEKGADLDEKNKEGNTALMCAANADAASRLLAKGADVDERNKEGMTALMCAAAGNRSDVIKVLLAKGVPVDEKDKNGCPSLVWASVAGRDSTAAMETLLAQGANVNACNHEAQTVLMLAVAWGDGENAKAVKLLLAKGANVNAKDKTGNTALMNAAGPKYLEIARLLKEAGAEVDLFSAAALGDAATVKARIVQGVDLNARCLDGLTPLMGAAVNNHADIVQILIAKKVDLEAQNEQGKTALAIATEKGLTEIVDLLKNAGAKP